MRDGFLKVACVTPDVKVADCNFNAEEIKKNIDEASKNGAKIIVFPELAITGYTCNDLFLQDVLIQTAKDKLIELKEASKEYNSMIFVGLPYEVDGKLYNVTAALLKGSIIAAVPKYNIPNYGEFYERRYFCKGNKEVKYIDIDNEKVPFGMNILLKNKSMQELVIAAEICEDVWVANPPSTSHATHGATLIINSSASDEVIGKDVYRRELIKGQSARLVCAYLYANAGEGESTQDLVFGGDNIIAENGSILAQSNRFENGIIYADVDMQRIKSERRRMTTYELEEDDDYVVVTFDMELEDTNLQRYYPRTPFVPSSKTDRDKRCEEILNIQSMGLKKRLSHTNCKSAVVGISGGLDSTLALIVTVRAFDMLNIDRKNIVCVTMPCFGTTDRTYNNAIELTKRLGATIREINIKEAVNVHFKDIGHDSNICDVTYENSQARERTQILMDIANQTNGMVIGTGDMSELALGWATYNGDHMSMYGVNASVPKTLVRHLVNFYADTCSDKELSDILFDILDTPVSPELLPPKDGEISQKTEDLVGPYELHDFFMYNILRYGMSPEKIYRIAVLTFEGVYSKETIIKWLKTFYRRFFAQQFKRSCLPDGPKVGSVAVSPRGDLRMPSDACATLWLEAVNRLEANLDK